MSHAVKKIKAREIWTLRLLSRMTKLDIEGKVKNQRLRGKGGFGEIRSYGRFGGGQKDIVLCTRILRLGPV